MRCTEVRRRLIELSGTLSESSQDRLIKNHLDNCPDCAAFARAEWTLQRDFKTLGADDNSETITPAELKDYVETAALKIQAKENIMSHIRRQYNTRPKLFAGLSLAMIAFLFITLVPFSYTHTVGFRVLVPSEDSKPGISPSLLEAALSSIGYENIEVSVSSDGGSEYYSFANLPSKNEANDLAAAFISLTGIKKKPIVKEIKRNISGTIYAQVAKKVEAAQSKPVRIRFDDSRLVINGTKISNLFYDNQLTDEEVGEAIREILRKSGVDDNEVVATVESEDGSNTRMLKLRLVRDDEFITEEPEIQIYVNDKEIAAILDRNKYDSSLERDSDIYIVDMDSTGSRSEHSIELEFPGGKKLGSENVIIKMILKDKDE